MSAADSEPGKGQTPNLSLLKEMVGVQQALKALVRRKLPLDRDVVLGVLEAQQQVYASEGLFRNKELVLREIITSLEHDAIDVAAVLQAAGFEATDLKPVRSRFSLGRLLGKT